MNSTLGVSLLLLFATIPSQSASIWINEIHYDNTSTDSGEFVEIAGLAGTDLSGLSLLLYNGGNGASYGSAALSGSIPNQQNGFGTLSFAVSGIQNGSPDGIALVSASSVLQFLSYEGAFTAVGGDADGMTSADIGVSESDSTPAGWSLQLIGTGSSYGDFTWASPMAATAGSPNTGQSFASAVPDGGSTALLLSIPLLGLIAYSRRI